MYAPGDPPPAPPVCSRATSTQVLSRLGGVNAHDHEFASESKRDMPRFTFSPTQAICVILILIGALAASLTLLVQQAMQLSISDASSTSSVSSSPSPTQSALQESFPSSSATPSSTPNTPSASSTPSTAVDDGLVNINTANQSDLETLPSIGPVMAQRILEYRQANGGFSSVEELTNVQGIGSKTLEKLRAHITVGSS